MRPAVLGGAAGIAAGAAVAALSRGPSLVHWPDRVRAAFPFILGGLAGGIVAIKVGSAAALVRTVRGTGGGPQAAPLIAGTVLAAGAVAAGYTAREVLLARLAEASRALDDGFAEPPAVAGVSGGPGSVVSVRELGREGARFVGTATTPDDVRTVTGRDPVATPVRVFIGVEAAATVEQRVGLAMAELRRTGAFDRSILIVQAPAGSGYANATPADVVEILALGDCASVAIGYGLLPSFLSLGKVEIAARTQALLLDAIRDELAGRTQRPRMVLYGESLGAKVQQAALPGGPIDLDAHGIDAALWVGTPGGRPADAMHARCAAESITIDRPEQIPPVFPESRPRVWFLEHDGDPVVRFRPEVATRRPDWLPADGSRGRNVPEAMTWRPGITWATALVDTLFATDIKPGDFHSLGHDYRADLGAVVTAAFGLPADDATAARLEEHLRVLEVQRAARIDATA